MPREFVLVAPERIEFRDYSEPLLGPGEVRVRSIVSGIKHGTEMALYTGNTPFLTQRFDLECRLFLPTEETVLYPHHLGSWLAGEVIEVGEGVTRFKVGDLVHGGLPHRPTNVARADQLYPLAPNANPETALFTDPALFALNAVHDAQLKLGDMVAIFGLGAIGLLAIQMARLNGAQRIFGVDLIPARRDLARRFGADDALDPAEGDVALTIKRATGNKGVDVAMEISGAYAALQQAIRSVQVGGRVVAASYYRGPAAALSLGAEWHHNRPTLISSMAVWGCPHRLYPMWDLDRLERTAIQLLERGLVSTEGMVTQRIPYSEAPRAYELIATHPDETIKVVLTYP
jgi:threonine dehydrogenase-like Zn-dependent dehydrogenase